MLYWVVLREFETGRLIQSWTFTKAKDAEHKRYQLRENPTTPDCHIDIEPHWHPERPKEFDLS